MEKIKTFFKNLNYPVVSLLLAGLVVFLLYLYFKKPNISAENKIIIKTETTKIDSLTRLINYRDQIIDNQKQSYQKLLVQKSKVKKEYQERLVTGIDTTCEKYVVTLEESLDTCNNILSNQNKQIQDLKSRDTSRIIVTNTLYKEIKIRDRKLFSGTLGYGIGYDPVQKGFYQGPNFTVGIKIFNF